MQERLASPPTSRVGTSSTTVRPRSSRIGRKSESTHLAAGLVEPDAGQVLILTALVLQARRRMPRRRLDTLELLDVEDGPRYTSVDDL